jgi:hypothetical protein
LTFPPLINHSRAGTSTTPNHAERHLPGGSKADVPLADAIRRRLEFPPNGPGRPVTPLVIVAAGTTIFILNATI